MSFNVWARACKLSHEDVTEALPHAERERYTRLQAFLRFGAGIGKKWWLNASCLHKLVIADGEPEEAHASVDELVIALAVEAFGGSKRRQPGP